MKKNRREFGCNNPNIQ